MRVKKTIWIFSMAVLLATLVLIVNSRIKLTHEVIIGGSDDVFIKTDNLKKPLDDYADTSAGAAEETLEYPNIDISDSQFILINSRYPSLTYAPSTKSISRSNALFDANQISNINSLIKAAKEEGFSPYIGCGYRDYLSQQYMFTSKANMLSADGTYSYDEAVELTKSIIAYPGTSDHQTGLGVDIADQYYEVYDYSKMDHEFFKWLDEHCAEYGFIKRYPSDKKDITGWDEPWHYRYVGKEAAQFIMENDLCLEEFIDHYR